MGVNFPREGRGGDSPTPFPPNFVSFLSDNTDMDSIDIAETDGTIHALLLSILIYSLLIFISLDGTNINMDDKRRALMFTDLYINLRKAMIISGLYDMIVLYDNMGEKEKAALLTRLYRKLIRYL
jgi:hypothetical protein